MTLASRKRSGWRSTAIFVVLVSLAARSGAVERATVMEAGKTARPIGDALRSQLAEAHFELVTQAAVVSALEENGYAGSEVARSAGGDSWLDPGLRRALQATPLDALGLVFAGKSSVRVILFELAGGTRLMDARFKISGKNHRVDGAELTEAVRQAIEKLPREAPAVATAPAAAPTLAPVVPKEPAVTAPPPRYEAQALVRFLVGAGGRQFSFRQPLSPQLRNFSLDAAPTVTGDVEAYPLRNLGAVAHFSISPGLISEVADTGESVPTTWYEWQAGARYRFALGKVLAAATLSYGQLAFVFTRPPVPGQLPDVRYANGRAALGATVPLGPEWRLSAEGGYRQMFSMGALDRRFPHSTGGGFDAALGAAYPFDPSTLFIMQARFEYFFQAFHPVPGDAEVAGGALDRYPSLDVGVQHAF